MAVPHDSIDPELELIFLGTGTSSAVPGVGCLTDPENGCFCCRSTLHPGGERNIRRNTCGLIKVHKSPGRPKTILIDAGKTFYTASLEWFPKKGLREIDALILTHPHADAMGGLDDLRGWTLAGAIQPSIDVYLNKFTYQELARMSPYLTSKDFATGGGDVPEFAFHIIEDDKPFMVHGVEVVPLPVHHGKFFQNDQPYLCNGYMFDRKIAWISDVSDIPESVWDILIPPTPGPTEASISTAEDVGGANTTSTSSSEAVAMNAVKSLQKNLDPSKRQDVTGELPLQPSSAQSTPSTSGRPPLVLVIDCLRLSRHQSHFGFTQAIKAARRLRSHRNYLIGFAHRISHARWVSLCEAIEHGQKVDGDLQRRKEYIAGWDWAAYGGCERGDGSDLESFIQHALNDCEQWGDGAYGPLFVRPSFDGLVVSLGKDKIGQDVAWDDDYVSNGHVVDARKET